MKKTVKWNRETGTLTMTGGTKRNPITGKHVSRVMGSDCDIVEGVLVGRGVKTINLTDANLFQDMAFYTS